MRYFLICRNCEWSFTIDEHIETVECPSCGESVTTEEATQQYAKKEFEKQSPAIGRASATDFQNVEADPILMRQQKALLLKEEVEIEKQRADRAAQEKLIAEKWLEEREQYHTIARALDGRNPIFKTHDRPKRDFRAMALVASLAGILIIWSAFPLTSCARQKMDAEKIELKIQQAP